jgi:iron complex outermembrane receptor protein
MRKSVLRTVIFSGSTLLPLLSSVAFAQTTATQGKSDQPEEIVVTSRQVSERLQDAPASITAFTAATLERAGIERAADFIDRTPGVSLVQTVEVGDAQVNIRGINGARDAETSFAYIVDGIALTNPAAVNREYNNLEQLEILKGPQGAIYGRNAEAGAIVVTTRQPGDMMEGDVKATVGNYSAYTLQGSVSGPVIPSVLDAQFSADRRSTNGEFTNVYQDKKDVDRFTDFDVNSRMIWKPDSDTTVDFKARYGKVDGAALDFNAVFALSGLASAFGVPALNENVNNHQFVYQSNIEPLNRQETTESSIKVDRDLQFATLSAWFLFSDVRNSFVADGTSGAFGFFDTQPACIASTAKLFAAGYKLPSPQYIGPSPVYPNSFYGPYTPTTCDGYQYQVRNQTDESAEIRLTSKDDGKFHWQVGLYYLHIDRQVGVSTGIDTGGPITQSLYVPGITEQLLDDSYTSNIYAGFSRISYDVTSNLAASLALRFDQEDRSVHNLVPLDAVSQYISPGQPINPGIVKTPSNPTGAIADKNATFDQPEPKVDVTWKVSPDLTAYANWGVGFKAGGFNSTGSAATVNTYVNDVLGTHVNISDEYKKEWSSAFEVGAKTKLFDDRVTLTGAVYEDLVHDMQFFEFFVGPFGLLRVDENIDLVVLKGAEVSANVRVTNWLSLYGGFNQTDSRIDKNTVRPESVGNKSPYTPDYTGNVGAQVIQPIIDGLNFVGRVDETFTGPTWFHVDQNQTRPTYFGTADYSQTQRAAFALTDLRLGVEAERWSVTGYSKNLLDKKYLAEVIPAVEFGGSFAAPGMGRTIGVEGRYRF